MPKRHAYTRFNLLPSAVIFLLIACSWTTSEDLPPTNLPAQKKPETFTNPILPAPSADPWMIQHNGVYYYAESRDGGIYVRTSTLIVDVAKDSGTRVWVPPRSGLNSREIWAPELHRIGGRWYIYFAADDGVNAHHKMWVAVSHGDDPLGAYDTCIQLNTGGKWAIDGTVLVPAVDSTKMYFIWSGWPGTTDGQQNLYIASMSSPTNVDSPRVLFSVPTESWEKNGMPLMEAPEALQHNRTTFIVYSTSGSWTKDYCLGLLVNTDGDFLNPASWTKRGPVFTANGSVYGVGHCSFVHSPDGTQDWIIYHAKEKATDGWEDRSARAQKFSWRPDDYPDFASPIAPGIPITVPSHR